MKTFLLACCFILIAIPCWAFDTWTEIYRDDYFIVYQSEQVSVESPVVGEGFVQAMTYATWDGLYSNAVFTATFDNKPKGWLHTPGVETFGYHLNKMFIGHDSIVPARAWVDLMQENFADWVSTFAQ